MDSGGSGRGAKISLKIQIKRPIIFSKQTISSRSSRERPKTRDLEDDEPDKEPTKVS